jgi:hypothetical protein
LWQRRRRPEHQPGRRFLPPGRLLGQEVTDIRIGFSVNNGN